MIASIVMTFNKILCASICFSLVAADFTASDYFALLSERPIDTLPPDQSQTSVYSLSDSLTSGNFFEAFDFFTGDDPTRGYVDYVDSATALESGLAALKSEQVFIGADTSNVASGRGRKSVRLESKIAYNKGLFVLDLEHMPTGCGTWPAFWMFGPNWPAGGEFDIIEGVHESSNNIMTAHTSAGCSFQNVNQTATQTHFDCTSPGGDNSGCGSQSTNPLTFGAGLNSIKGGVYAMEWTSSGFKTWFFPRSAIPADISTGAPNPQSWPLPELNYPFIAGCAPTFFQNMKIIFNLTFCGEWAGAVWATGTCAAKAPTCDAYVQNSPEAFTDAYWLINSLKTYKAT